VILLRVEGSQTSSAAQPTPAKSADEQPQLAETAQRLIDRLTVGAEVGKGVLGTVYHAECRDDGRLVALKIVQPKIEIGAAERRRVLEGMERFQQLRHPNIVALLEVGTLRRSLYFALEWCDGGRLDQWLAEQGGKLILGQARPLMFQCLDGLDDAHRQGLVHGDLKPQNILLHRQDNKRVARIADFGLARILEQAGCSGLTTTGQVPINYHFLPRERVVDFRQGHPLSDVWSLAAVFYHVLTGQFPRDFARRDPIAVILHSEAVPIRERNPQVPKPVAQVIDRALAAHLDKRFRDAAEMKAQLQRAFGQVRGD
jgi:serine/threonine protein kinase